MTRSDLFVLAFGCVCLVAATPQSWPLVVVAVGVAVGDVVHAAMSRIDRRTTQRRHETALQRHRGRDFRRCAQHDRNQR